MPHYIKIYPFSVPQCLMLVSNLNLIFPPLNPAVFPAVCPCLQLKWAPHHPTIGGASLVVRLTFTLVSVWPPYKYSIVKIFSACLFFFLPPTISQPSSPGSTRPAWPDPPPRSPACPRAQRRTPPWRGSVGGGSGSLSLTRNMSSWPRVVASEVKLPQSISLC